MITKLIILGVETILKTICEKIIIKNINIVNKNDKFNGRIDELFIKAESVIFKKIIISNINIKIRDIILKFAISKKNYFFDTCHASISMKLSKDNINKTLLNKKWRNLKNSIEAFISMSFESIDIINKSILFISPDGFSNEDIRYTLHYHKNTISLVNNINQKRLLILNDENIIVNNLFFSDSYIELELNSKIIIN